MATTHTFTPTWRGGKEPVTVLEGATLAAIAGDRSYRHDGEPRVMVRFEVTDCGRVFCGDAWFILHKDICGAFMAIGAYGASMAGVAVLAPGGSTWAVHLQPFGVKDAEGLLGRLTTWAAFVEGAVWAVVPYGGSLADL